MLVCWGWYAAVVGLWMIPAIRPHQTLLMLISIVSAFGATTAMSVLGADKKGLLELDAARIVLDGNILPRQGLRAELAVWKLPSIGTTTGAAMILRNGTHSWCLGGRNHILPSGADLPVVTKVTASLSAEDFGKLLGALGLHSRHGESAQSHDSIAIDLVQSPTSLRGLWSKMSPWIATMAVVSLMSIVAGAFGWVYSQSGQVIVTSLIVVVLAAGLVITFRHNARPPTARYRLVVKPTGTTLLDAVTAKTLETSAARPKASRVAFRYVTRGGTYEFAAVRLEWPTRSMVIGIWDSTYHWPAGTPRTRRLHYVVGGAEWERLVRALGVH